MTTPFAHRWLAAITHLLEILVIFVRRNDIVVFARLLISQPSTVPGRAGGIGRGWPKATQNKNASAVRLPVIAPPSVADSVLMPSVKTPNSGPPTTPKIVNPACV